MRTFTDISVQAHFWGWSMICISKQSSYLPSSQHNRLGSCVPSPLVTTALDGRQGALVCNCDWIQHSCQKVFVSILSTRFWMWINSSLTLPTLPHRQRRTSCTPLTFCYEAAKWGWLLAKQKLSFWLVKVIYYKGSFYQKCNYVHCYIHNLWSL